jgi:nicotinate-nucleotide adenylyltransferase
MEALDLAQVRMIPAQIPPHRGSPELSPAQRLALLRLAIADCPGFVEDTRELERSGPSYMVDTLSSLRAELPQTPLCLIVGMDAFLGLPRWHRWRELAEYAHFVVLDRPGAELPVCGELSQWLTPRLTENPGLLRESRAGRVYLQQVTQLAISATQIRALLAAQRSARFLLPDVVWHAVREQKLYGYGQSM